MTYRPDLVDCWIFRVPERGEPEILLIKRSTGRILPGLWQCVSGSIEPDERIALAALREVREETGFDSEDIEAFYDLDLVNQFHEPSVDAVMSSAVFALRVRADRDPVLSHEHVDWAWLPLVEASRQSVWPGYREAIQRISDNLFDPDRSPWFHLDLEGGRAVG